MLSESVKKKLDGQQLRKEDSYGRQIYFLYRYLVHWVGEQSPNPEGMPLGPSHYHLLFTVGLKGVSNSELARRAKVSKQAMYRASRATTSQPPQPAERRTTERAPAGGAGHHRKWTHLHHGCGGVAASTVA